ncbi:hypothetical protein [Mastigocoleus testarum]|uniref:hypothetical protein n=1 Tax=Mastigocoleus testarum TaxID=996925 RepID=UPI001910A1EC|nr:hypothetical protein [Mastigocoleus testarum]
MSESTIFFFYSGQLPTTNYQLPITHYPLPITHYPLPITHYPLPITNAQVSNRYRHRFR